MIDNITLCKLYELMNIRAEIKAEISAKNIALIEIDRDIRSLLKNK